MIWGDLFLRSSDFLEEVDSIDPLFGVDTCLGGVHVWLHFQGSAGHLFW